MWIAFAVGTVLVALLAAGIVAVKISRLHPVDGPSEALKLSTRQIAMIGSGLALMAFLIVGFTPISMWFLAPAVFVTTWVPQVSKRSIDSSSSIVIAAVFTVSVALTAAVRLLFFWD